MCLWASNHIGLCFCFNTPSKSGNNKLTSISNLRSQYHSTYQKSINTKTTNSCYFPCSQCVVSMLVLCHNAESICEQICQCEQTVLLYLISTHLLITTSHIIFYHIITKKYYFYYYTLFISFSSNLFPRNKHEFN